MIEINKIYQESCLETLDKMDSNSIDLIVTSPPYNLGINYDSYDDKIDWSNYYSFIREWLDKSLRVLKPDGRMCINHYLSCGNSNERQSPLMNINSIAIDVGYKHHGVAVWMEGTIAKLTAWGSWISASAPYISNPLEGILILYKDQWKKQNKGITGISKEEFIEGCSGIWKFSPERNREHPAPFPVALPKRCILLFSYEQDLVYDPFIGSGTTFIACMQTNRNCIGSEISSSYCDMANKRIETLLKERSQLELF